MSIGVANKKLTEDEFFAKRKEVISQWPTAKEIDLDEAIEYRKKVPKHKRLIDVLAKAKHEGRILACVHHGYSLVEPTIEHLKAVQDAGADIANLVTDTYSRRGKWAEAEKALQESIKQGKSLLNGFPIVNHGLKAAKRIREAVDMPIMLVDPESEHCELLTEFGMASGFEHVSCDLESVLRTSRDYPIEQKMREAQFQNRLVGYYLEHGAPAHTLVISHLNATIDPPGIKIVIGVLHALMVAEQGVKNIGTDVGLNAQLFQDVASLRVLRRLTEEYLKKFRYDCVVSIGCVQYGGPWPRDKAAVLAACGLNSTIPILGGADWVVLKSTSEAFRIPPIEANVAAVELIRQLISTIGRQKLGEDEQIKTEEKMIELEARSIIDKVLELGGGDPAVGQIRAIDSGVIDVQFSPCRRVKGQVVALRDSLGAVRYIRWGNIPLPNEVVDYNAECIAKRRKENPRKTVEMMIDDVSYLSGKLK